MRLRSSRGGFALPTMPGMVRPGHELRGPADWPAVFHREAPFVVEIGFGKDPFLLDRAEAHPGEDHVGVERDLSRVERFLELATARGLSNVRALPVSAELALGSCFADGSVGAIHVYFPDPWPKKRHARHRLVRPWFARESARVLADGASLVLATDEDAYAEQMREVIGAVAAFTSDPVADPGPGGDGTKFERLWRSRGRSIHRLHYRATAGTVAAAGGAG